MRILLDTNVVLDVLLAREPWQSDSLGVWHAIDQGLLRGYLPASAVTDIYYVARRLSDATRAREAVRLCLDAFEIAPVDRTVLERAQTLGGTDYEDDVQIACAQLNSLDGIVTRDGAGFAAANLAVWTPNEVLARLRDQRGPI